MKKLVLIFASLFVLSFATVEANVDVRGDLTLPEPYLEKKVDLLTVFELRKSTKSFQDQQVSLNDLATILWAANGINRENGKRTAPAAFGKYFIDIYVASDRAIYLYEPEKNSLKYISDNNLKSKLGRVSKTGSYVLILTAKLNELPFFVGKEEKVNIAYGNGGCIGENVYLMANALDLGTCIKSSIKKSLIERELELTKNEIPLYIMPLGYPDK